MSDYPRLLAVEDDRRMVETIKSQMARPPMAWLKGTGVSGLRIDIARCVEDARDLLRKSRKRQNGYEAVLLDLGLPLTMQDLDDENVSPENGRQLLTEIRHGFPHIAVLVYTRFATPRNYVHAIQWGAADFVEKPDQLGEGLQELLGRLVACVGRTRRAVHDHLSHLRELRIAELDRKLRHERLSKRISEEVSRVSDAVRELSQLLSQRYGLDLRQDVDDPICRQLAAAKEAVASIAENTWRGLPETEAAYRVVEVGDLVREETRRVWPCHLHRGVSVQEDLRGPLQTKTFKEDLGLMVAQLVLDTMDAAPDGDSVKVSCQRSEDGNEIVISAERSGEPISQEVRRLLEAGEWPEDEPDSLARGLCFLQRMANNIGGRLEVPPAGERQVVTLRIPVIGDE